MFCEYVGAELGFGPSRMERLRYAALMHDIGKLIAYNDDPLSIDLTDAGRLQGEIPLGYYTVRRAIEDIPGFDPHLAQCVLHIILSHHGSLEHGSPVVPATREAVLVHMMDNLGGRLGSFDRLERQLPEGESWSGFDRALSGSKRTGRLTAVLFVDLDDFKSKLDDRTAVFMITNPNTVGLFDPQVGEIATLLHDRGALLYLDGANMNAILGAVRPGDMGGDLMHYNPHRTFSGPHGGGGPVRVEVIHKAEAGILALDAERDAWLVAVRLIPVDRVPVPAVRGVSVVRAVPRVPAAVPARIAPAVAAATGPLRPTPGESS